MIAMFKSLGLDQIRVDGGTQSRAGIDAAVVQEYTHAWQAGTSFPPIDVFYDGQEYWLADGFHRLQACRQAGQQYITADVHQGSRRDAVLFSVGANAKHGLRRTNADKRRGVELLLSDEEWGQRSDNWIAEHAQVSQPFVRSLRRELDQDKVSAVGLTSNESSNDVPSTSYNRYNPTEPEVGQGITPENSAHQCPSGENPARLCKDGGYQKSVHRTAHAQVQQTSEGRLMRVFKQIQTDRRCSALQELFDLLSSEDKACFLAWATQ